MSFHRCSSFCKMQSPTSFTTASSLVRTAAKLFVNKCGMLFSKTSSFDSSKLEVVGSSLDDLVVLTFKFGSDWKVNCPVLPGGLLSEEIMDLLLAEFKECSCAAFAE